MSKFVGTARCNPEDVIGKHYGVFEVVEYVGVDFVERPNGKSQKRHKYKIRCTLCGGESIVCRNNLKRKAKQERCNKCFHQRDIRRPNKMADPNEMIGKIVNGYEIVELVDIVPFHSKTTGAKRFKYYYNCKCTDCGMISKHERLVLKRQDSKGLDRRCPFCGVKEHIDMMRSKIDYGKVRGSQLVTWKQIRHTKEEAEANNITTGVRHYCITQQKVQRQGYIRTYYRHVIQIIVGGKTYKIIDKSLGPSVDTEIKQLAEEMNKVLLSGNDKDFFEWYENYKKNSK